MIVRKRGPELDVKGYLKRPLSSALSPCYGPAMKSYGKRRALPRLFCEESRAACGSVGVLLPGCSRPGELLNLVLFGKGRLLSCDPRRAVSTDYNMAVSP